MKKIILFTLPLFFYLLIGATDTDAEVILVDTNKDDSKTILEITTDRDNFLIADSVDVLQNDINLSIDIENELAGTIVSGKDTFSVFSNIKNSRVTVGSWDRTIPLTIRYDILNNKTNQVIKKTEIIRFDESSLRDTKKSCLTSSLTTFLTNALHNQNSFLLLFIIFLLGLVMSLTPCIYPMIPITISILGIDQKTFGQRLFAGILYMLGIGITFSILGLLTASGKIIFGSIMSNSIFIILSTIVLLLMTLNMLGLTGSIFIFHAQIRLPTWIQNSSLLPFFYGIVSGTITSPCVSPGLLGLLTLVGQQNNLFIGWLWLFLFGCGLAFPLFLIALISNTALQLPDSGTWMNTLKEFLGIVLLFVIHKNIILISNFTIATIIITAIFIIYFTHSLYQQKSISIGLIFSVLVFTSLLCMVYKSDNESITDNHNPGKIFWIDNIEQAKTEAHQNKKLVLVDFTADWCSICKEVEKKLFHKADFIDHVIPHAILCRIDCTNSNENIQKLMKQYKIKGLPTIFLLNPEDNTILASYHGEILDQNEQKLINTIKKIKKERYHA